MDITAVDREDIIHLFDEGMGLPRIAFIMGMPLDVIDSVICEYIASETVSGDF
jgi:hypothetical protein